MKHKRKLLFLIFLLCSCNQPNNTNEHDWEKIASVIYFNTLHHKKYEMKKCGQHFMCKREVEGDQWGWEIIIESVKGEPVDYPFQLEIGCGMGKKTRKICIYKYKENGTLFHQTCDQNFVLKRLGGGQGRYIITGLERCDVIGTILIKDQTIIKNGWIEK